MWASAAGEEAALVATVLAAADADWIYPGMRDAAVALARGVDYDTIATALLGRSTLPGWIASAKHRIGTTTDALGMQLALASGQAHGHKLLRDGAIADPLGVFAAVAAAADRARDGRGPALVEVVVTQLGRDPPAHRDPIERLRRHLDAAGLWTQTWEDVIEAEVRQQLDRAFTQAHKDLPA
jgi:TPP-dependent pyruvate/acetoin dehydrogenase alpha subunit